MTSKFVEIGPVVHLQGNCIPFAAIRWPDFSERPPFGRPFRHFSRHPDTPLLPLSPRHRLPQPTPGRLNWLTHVSAFTQLSCKHGSHSLRIVMTAITGTGGRPRSETGPRRHRWWPAGYGIRERMVGNLRAAMVVCEICAKCYSAI